MNLKLIRNAMKTNFLNTRNYFLVLVTGIVLSSCSKDDVSTADNLAGTWTVGTSSHTIMVGDKTLMQYYTGVMGMTTAQAQVFIDVYNLILQESFTGTIQLNSDNTYTSTLGGSADSGTWSLSSDNKKLTINSTADGPIIFDIISQTANSLELKAVDTVNDDLNGDSIPELITITINVTCNKQ